MPRPDPADLAARLAAAGTRRSFLARVGAAVFAVVGGKMVAAAIAPEEAQSFHFCGHTFTTGSCPHPGRHPRIDRHGKPLRTSDGRPIDNLGRLIDAQGYADRRERQAAARARWPAAAARAAHAHLPGLGARALRPRCAPAGLVVPVLRRPDPEAVGLLRDHAHARQRRRRPARLLLRRAATSSASPTTTRACRADRARALHGGPDRRRVRAPGAPEACRWSRPSPPPCAGHATRTGARPGAVRRGRDRRRRCGRARCSAASARRPWSRSRSHSPCRRAARDRARAAAAAAVAAAGAGALAPRAAAAALVARLRRRARRRRPHLPAGGDVPGGGGRRRRLRHHRRGAGAVGVRRRPRARRGAAAGVRRPDGDLYRPMRRVNAVALALLALALVAAPAGATTLALGPGSQLDPSVADDGTLAYTQRADSGTDGRGRAPGRRRRRDHDPGRRRSRRSGASTWPTATRLASRS